MGRQWHRKPVEDMLAKMETSNSNMERSNVEERKTKAVSNLKFSGFFGRDLYPDECPRFSHGCLGCLVVWSLGHSYYKN